ncbi:MAG: ADP-ribose-binding protein [Nitrospiraceae bacterium]
MGLAMCAAPPLVKTMQGIKGNIWTFHPANWIVIPTNGSIKKDGCAVMGRGLALDASRRYPLFPQQLGQVLKQVGNHNAVWAAFKIITFPVKHEWHEEADITLIEESMKNLITVPFGDIYMPRVGCGNGRLKWEDVKPIIEQYVDDRFIIVHP